MVPAGAAAPPNTDSGVLNATGLADLNGGAARIATTPFSAADFMPPGMVESFSAISGADMGGVFPERSILDNAAKAAARDDGVEVTLTPGPNTIFATIKSLPRSRDVYPHWADFVVPAGFIATDFRVMRLDSGAASTWTAVPGFSILDNWGNPVYSYMASYYTMSGRRDAQEYPTPLAQLVLNPLFRDALPRPYRVFCSGVDGAVVSLSCNLIASAPTGGVVLGSGKLQVTLTWDGADATAIATSDLDLHVIEPDGTEVRHNNKIGTFGNLDRDDQSGYGPENYFVTGTPAAGQIYRVWVNNWDSTPNVNALVRIKTDYETKVFPINWGTTFNQLNVATITFHSSSVTITDTRSTPRMLGPKTEK
jgi:hypothetical protein